MNDYRRQVQLLIAALRQIVQQGGTPMRMEMSEIFEPALGIMFDSITYLQNHFSGKHTAYISTRVLLLRNDR